MKYKYVLEQTKILTQKMRGKKKENLQMGLKWERSPIVGIALQSALRIHIGPLNSRLESTLFQALAHSSLHTVQILFFERWDSTAGAL